MQQKTLGFWWYWWMEALYRYHYGLGLHTIRLFRRLGRLTVRLTRGPRRWVRYMWLRHAVRPVHRFRRRMRRLGGGMAALFRRGGEKQTFSAWCKEYREEWFSLGRMFGPLVGGAALAVTLIAWTNTTFCLGLSYRGHDLGVVDNAAVYDVGANMARDRVNNVDDTFAVDVVPTFTLQIQGKKAPLTGTQICNGILGTATDSNFIAEGVGLYVDDEFIAAMESPEELNGLLDSLKEGRYDKNNPDQRAEFVQKVVVEEGLYPYSAMTDIDNIKGHLMAETETKSTYTVVEKDTFSGIAKKHDMTMAELKALNPQCTNVDKLRIGDELLVRRPQYTLQVKVVETIRYTEKIDYTTKTVYLADKPTTYSKVTTKGVEGSQNVTAEITKIDGYEVGRSVVNRVVTKQPVTQVVEKGIKRVNSSSGSAITQGDGVTRGKMTWPVPICRNMSRGYRANHYAIDIANGPVKVLGKPAVAADGGKVIQAATGWNGGYGNVVKIQHSNGLITVYAHLQSIKVVKGQQVSRGQTIGLVGNTGNSRGPHLHFEVIKNGVKVNPLNYVSPKS